MTLQLVHVSWLLFLLYRATSSMPVHVWQGDPQELYSGRDIVNAPQIEQTTFKDVEANRATLSSNEQFKLLGALTLLVEPDVRAEVDSSSEARPDVLPGTSRRVGGAEWSMAAITPHANSVYVRKPSGQPEVVPELTKRAPRRLSVSAAIGTLSDLFFQVKLERAASQSKAIHQRLMSVGR